MSQERDIRRGEDYELVVFYPPAKTFSPTDPEDVFAGLREASRQNPQREPLGLYIHIPFCTGRCSYCHYITWQNPSDALIDCYLEALEAELRILSKRGVFAGRPASFVHVGGGTPTILSIDGIRKLVTALQESLVTERDAEISWEASPETITEPKLQQLFEGGATRLSIGIQALDDDLLQTCARRHTARDAQNAVRLAQAYGIHNLNVDLIYGLPGQDSLRWQETLAKTCALEPSSVTIYQLRRKAGTAFATLGSRLFPDAAQCLKMQRLAIGALAQAGYRQVQPNQFVLRGKPDHQYVRLKWGDGAEFLGIGVSAYSFYGDWTFSNTSSLPSYVDRLAQSRLPTAMGRLMTPDQAMRKDVILGLKLLDVGVRKKRFEQRHRKGLFEVFGATLLDLLQHSLIIEDREAIRLTPRGALVADEICIQFYSSEDRTLLSRKGATKYGAYLDLPAGLAAAYTSGSCGSLQHIPE